MVIVQGGRQSSGCSRLKLMISDNECIFVTLKSRMNSAKHSLNSESAPYQHVSGGIEGNGYLHTTGSKQLFPSIVRLD
jgi:hypothetical protein